MLLIKAVKILEKIDGVEGLDIIKEQKKYYFNRDRGRKGETI